MKTLRDWLDSKVLDDEIPDKYSKTTHNIPPYLNRYESDDYFNRYYTKDDDDVKTADTFYPDLIDNMLKVNPQDVHSSTQLKFLDSITERYESKKFLIPPNTNRHHTNFLFKNLVDYSDMNGYNYEILDSKGNIIKLPFLGNDIKTSFYKFCKDNTYRN